MTVIYADDGLVAFPVRMPIERRKPELRPADDDGTVDCPWLRDRVSAVRGCFVCPYFDFTDHDSGQVKCCFPNELSEYYGIGGEDDRRAARLDSGDISARADTKALVDKLGSVPPRTSPADTG